MNERDRTHYFLPKKVNLLDERESSKLKVRKEKLEEYIMSRRVKNNFEENKYEIKLKDLTLPEKVIKNYEKEINKIDTLIDLLQSDDLNIHKFALLNTRLYTLENPSNSVEYNTEEYLKIKYIIELMLNLLKNSCDKEIQFESSFILLNITANTDFFNNLLLYIVDNLSVLMNSLLKFEEEEQIYENVLWMFSNFFLIEAQAKYIMENTQFYKLIFNRFTNKQIYLSHLKITFVWLFTNILRSNFELTEENSLVIPLMNLLNEAMCNQNYELLHETLTSIQILVERNTKTISKFLNKDIVKLIINLINSTVINNHKTHKLCFSLLGCLLLGTVEECKFIISHKVIELSGLILEILIENLSKEINKIAIEISFMLSNAVYNDIDSTIKVLVQDQILENLLKIDSFFESYEFKKHLLLLLKNCVSTMDINNYNIFVNSQGFDWIFKCMNSHYHEFIYDSLKITEQVLEFNRITAGDMSEAVRKLEKHSIDKKLNELILTKMNKKLSGLSNKILEEYFDKIENNSLN